LSEENCRLLGLVFHSIITSYQKTIREALGYTDSAILNLADCLSENVPLGNVDVAKLGFEGLIDIMAERIENMKLGRVVLVKQDEGHYLFRFEHCVWAEANHKNMMKRDVTCPMALIAMALYQDATGKKVYVADSEYLRDGTVTSIRPASDISFQSIG